MLVLQRKPDQTIIINDRIVVRVLGIQGGRVRLGIEAPEQVRIRRSELRQFKEHAANRSPGK